MKFTYMVNIKIYGRISPSCSPISHEPQHINTFAKSGVDMKNLFMTLIQLEIMNLLQIWMWDSNSFLSFLSLLLNFICIYARIPYISVTE